MPEPVVPAAAVRLHRALLARGETVAAAESLTAGLLCATLATVPGASATLRGGVVVYATDLKTALAGVPVDLLAEHGPVSPETAAALADGVRERCRATWGIALTGVAGPDSVDGHRPGTGLPRHLRRAEHRRRRARPGRRPGGGAGRGGRGRHERPAGPPRLTGNATSAPGVTPSADACRSVGPRRCAPRTVSARRHLRRRRFPARRTGDGHDAAAHPAREHLAWPPAESAPDAARRLRRRPGQPRLPVGGRARAEGSLLGAPRLDLRRPRRRTRRPARRGQPRAAGRRRRRRPPAGPLGRRPGRRDPAGRRAVRRGRRRSPSPPWPSSVPPCRPARPSAAARRSRSPPESGDTRSVRRPGP